MVVGGLVFAWLDIKHTNASHPENAKSEGKEQRTGGDTSTQAATTTPGEPTTSFDGRCGGLIFWPRVLRNSDVTHLPFVGREGERERDTGRANMQCANAQLAKV